ncbi:RDD family protein [Bacillus piscicola]|uniref:RDD family protein n=1 Tax=Bacillus piscicola TaxID=1632684 RepID=UPI001F08C25D|nr:RDD family protein [Bacillus piscicola]
MDNQINEEFVAEEHVPVSLGEYAGFWMRFWAYLFDLLIVFSVNGILLSPLMFLENASVTLLGFFTLQGLLSVVVSYVYFVVMTKYFGQTLGKMILGIKVVHKDGTPLRWSDLIFREVIGRFIYRSVIITNVLYLIVGFMDEKQGIHDIFGDTRVVHVEK